MTLSTLVCCMCCHGVDCPGIMLPVTPGAPLPGADALPRVPTPPRAGGDGRGSQPTGVPDGGCCAHCHRERLCPWAALAEHLEADHPDPLGVGVEGAHGREQLGAAAHRLAQGVATL
jgi:hypothetical protein